MGMIDKGSHKSRNSQIRVASKGQDVFKSRQSKDVGNQITAKTQYTVIGNFAQSQSFN